jgi:hypothetical protein
LYLHKLQSFSPNRSLKNAGTIHFIFGGQTAIQTKIVQRFGGIFHQIKVCQPIGRKNSIQTAFRRMRRFGGIFVFSLAAQNFKLFSKI